MATTDLSVLNAALTRIGEEEITSLDGAGVAEAIARSNYESLVSAHLSVHPWKRASYTVQLARLDPLVEGQPPEPWTAAYQLPPDTLEIRTVKVGGQAIPYQIMGDVVLCDAGATDAVILHAVFRAREADWPQWFREGITIQLEAIFLRGIGERYREAELREDAAAKWWLTAKNRDAQSEPPRKPVGSPVLLARRGGGGMTRC
jgi:hypothetical protein